MRAQSLGHSICALGWCIGAQILDAVAFMSLSKPAWLWSWSSQRGCLDATHSFRCLRDCLLLDWTIWVVDGGFVVRIKIGHNWAFYCQDAQRSESSWDRETCNNLCPERISGCRVQRAPMCIWRPGILINSQWMHSIILLSWKQTITTIMCKHRDVDFVRVRWGIASTFQCWILQRLEACKLGFGCAASDSWNGACRTSASQDQGDVVSLSLMCHRFMKNYSGWKSMCWASPHFWIKRFEILGRDVGWNKHFGKHSQREENFKSETQHRRQKSQNRKARVVLFFVDFGVMTNNIQ